MKSYYDSGIPDEEWYISPGEKGQSVQYFPHFEEEHFGNLYWFSFYMESFYTRFEGLIDTVYHVINIKYKFDFEPALGFRKKVLKGLKVVDKDLFDYLDALPDNIVFQKVKDFRNNIVHNYRPNQIDSGYTKVKKTDGSQNIRMSIGNYTTSSEFLINIYDSLDLLGEITDTIRGKVELK
ncbi:Cthe_2314 family HEPN domain-containing protein [Gottfriedia luciferensis]|uniref:Cthe_2314 family HEPN domain-containing protein n=1 Tax=Gottfriedia luciferensis TaxID=178774 RepID=UPI001EE9DD0D